tara:strand:+ start:460 stop:660 length:201 start_codon:yes stop_codon:yes gene_type:complete
VFTGGKLPGQVIETPYPLNSHQEGLVFRQSGLVQGCHLLAQMIFQFRHVYGLYRLPSTQIVPPPVD